MGDQLAPDDERVTAEVASEGGSPGDVEVEHGRVPLKGSERTSTVTSTTARDVEHRHDETGEGRRSP